MKVTVRCSQTLPELKLVLLFKIQFNLWSELTRCYLWNWNIKPLPTYCLHCKTMSVVSSIRVWYDSSNYLDKHAATIYESLESFISILFLSLLWRFTTVSSTWDSSGSPCAKNEILGLKIILIWPLDGTFSGAASLSKQDNIWSMQQLLVWQNA